MFKRKDEDIDLLSDAGGSMSKNEPKMSATPMAAPTTPTPAATTASTATATKPTTPAAAPTTPTTPTATATPAAGGYTRPNDSADSSRVSRPASFRPEGGGRAGSDYRPAGGGNAAPSAMSASHQADKSKGRRVLTVGHDILLKGEIATCDRLVIEGAVDATLNEVHTVEIAETGSFKGAAEIEDAEISGVFDGELIVRNRLVIYSTGQVRGKITYGEIEIERGGEMTGTIKSYKGDKSSLSTKKSSTKSSKDKDAKVKEAA